MSTEIKHIALIPDGNRRWAKKHNLPGFMGHREGAKSAEKIYEKAFDLKIPYVSFWGCSISNLTERDPAEVKFLLELFEQHFKKFAKSEKVHENKVNITAIGKWRDYFTPSCSAAVDEMVEATKDYNNLHLNFLLGYSGTEEMLSAIKKLKDSGKEINGKNLKDSLYTSGLPPVDLVIRTGGEPHISTGFMMWDTAEAGLYFTETLWPDFSPEEFQKAIDTVAKTEKRRGK